MFDTKAERDWIEVNLSSTDELAEQAAEACDNFVQQFSPGRSGDFRLCVRELLTLTIAHGNEFNADLEISCRVDNLSNDRYKIEVSSDGKGFDAAMFHADPAREMADAALEGLPLVRGIADRVLYNDYKKSVTAYVTVQKLTTFAITPAGDGQIVTPSGMLNSASAEDLRMTLAGLVDSGCGRYRFDFANVTDIDSLSLGVLVSFQRAMAEQSLPSPVVVENANGDVQSLFRVTRMDQVFEIRN